jgi:cellulose synthase operon protein C
MASRRSARKFVALAALAGIGVAVADPSSLQGVQDALARGDAATAQLRLDQARIKGAPPSQSRLLQAEAALLQGQYDAVKTHVGNDRGGQHLLGLAILRQGDAAKARTLIEGAVADQGKVAAHWIALARLRVASGDRPGATAAIKRALTIEPKNAEAMVLGGNLFRDSYGLRPALAWYDRALAARPGRIDAVFERAATLGDSGRSRDALAATRELLRLSPGNAQAFYQQAVIAARAGNFDLSRRMMFRVGARLDGQPGAILLRAISELQGKNYEGAASRLQGLQKAQPNNLRIRRLLGLALWRQGQLADAIFTLGPIADRGDGTALLIIGRAYEAMGDQAAAANALDKAMRAQATLPDQAVMAKLDAFLAANPANVWAQRAAADRALSLGDAAGAATLYRALSARLGAADPVRLANAAWADTLSGADGGGLADAERAYAAAPMNPVVTATYGAILRRGGDAKRAVSLLEKAIILAPEEPRIAQELAAALNEAARAN